MSLLARRERAQTGGRVESQIGADVAPAGGAARAVAGHLRALHVRPWEVVLLGVGWAAIWGLWALVRAGSIPAQPGPGSALTLATVSASACWLSAFLGSLALRDLVQLNRRWRRGEYRSVHLASHHPLWLPVVLLLVGLAFGRWFW